MMQPTEGREPAEPDAS